MGKSKTKFKDACQKGLINLPAQPKEQASEIIVYIGIDPGVCTGIAIWSTLTQSFSDIKTTDFWEAIRIIEAVIGLFSIHSVKVRIEDPGINKPIFWKQRKHITKLQTAVRMAQNVGMNKKEADLMIKYFERNKIQYEAVRPSEKKWTKEYFLLASQWKGSVSKHGIDAARLVIGMR